MSGQEGFESPATEDISAVLTPSTGTTETRMFSGVNALGWSAGVAVLTGLATCAGMVRESGRSSALALYSLSRPAIDQRDTFRGMNCLLSSVLVTLVAFVIAHSIYRVAGWGFRKIALGEWLSNRWTRANRVLPWIALTIALADVGFLNVNVIKLVNESEGIILKHTSDAGTLWTDILLDEDRTAESGYMLLFGAGMALFLGLSWWLINAGVKGRIARIALSLWAGTQVLSLTLAYSYLVGVTDTIGEFPVVAFSGSDQLVPHSCPVLLGSDDKQFAILIINCQEKPEGLQKYLLYLPRAEVKWMSVIRVTQLQPLSRLDDLKRLLQQDTH